MHLRSDVPIGATLSGGLDSSAIVCAMRYIEPNIPIHTFSYIARDTSGDEEYWIDIVNKHANCIAHKIYIDPEEINSDIKSLIFNQGEPFAGASIYAQYRIFREVQKKGIKVVLDGQGADELLAGYDGYETHYVESLLDRHAYVKVASFLYAWSKGVGRNIFSGFKILVDALLRKYATFFRHKIQNKRFITPVWIDKKFFQSKEVNIAFQKKQQVTEKIRCRKLMGVLRDDLSQNRISRLLRYADRNAMAYSVENRVPFLTTGLAEFIFSLPESYIFSNSGTTKFVFREAMRGIVPDEIIERKEKFGFSTPEDIWFRSILRNFSELKELVIDTPQIKNNECFDIIDGLTSNNRGYTPDMWRLMNFSFWKKMIDS